MTPRRAPSRLDRGRTGQAFSDLRSATPRWVSEMALAGCPSPARRRKLVRGSHSGPRQTSDRESRRVSPERVQRARIQDPRGRRRRQARAAAVRFAYLVAGNGPRLSELLQGVCGGVFSAKSCNLVDCTNSELGKGWSWSAGTWALAVRATCPESPGRGRGGWPEGAARGQVWRQPESGAGRLSGQSSAGIRSGAELRPDPEPARDSRQGWLVRLGLLANLKPTPD